MEELSGIHCVITGNATGLGAHMWRVLEAHGATLSGLSNVAAEEDMQDRTHIVDITDETAARLALETIADERGPISCLINNAGTSQTSGTTFEDVMHVNAIAPARLTELVADRMIANQIKGSIINISSCLAHSVFVREAAYGASKAALESITKQHAMKYARDGIRVNALALGWFETGLTSEMFAKGFEAVLRGRVPMARLGDMDDIDAALMLLASPRSSYITGSTIFIDGGYSVNRF